MRQTRRVGPLAVLPVLWLLAGCASMKPMGLSESLASLPERKEAVAFFSLRTVNKHKPGYQPNVSYVFVWEDGKDDRQKYSFKVDDPYREGKDEFNEYLVSLRLPAGKYMLREIYGTAGYFPIRGSFGAPVFTRFEVAPGTIGYLGRIEATIRARAGDNELRAGSLIPLIDQSVTGMSNGTFDIVISDNYDDDVAAFTGKYPALIGTTIGQSVLPPWHPPSEEAMK
jgi:hypothetical protein